MSPYKSPAVKKLAAKIEITRNMAINRVMRIKALNNANKQKLVKNLNTMSPATVVRLGKEMAKMK
jgi:hypothetical protein